MGTLASSPYKEIGDFSEGIETVGSSLSLNGNMGYSWTPSYVYEAYSDRPIVKIFRDALANLIAPKRLTKLGDRTGR